MYIPCANMPYYSISLKNIGDLNMECNLQFYILLVINTSFPDVITKLTIILQFRYDNNYVWNYNFRI